MSDSEDECVERQLKIVIVGDPNCGKTSIASRYCNDEFTRQYYPTPGVDFFLKKTVLPGGKNVTLKIWDVGGQSLSGNMLDKYVYGANVVLLVYDLTNITSFINLEDWLDAVRRATATQDHKPSIVLIGNKCDQDHQRAVRFEKQHKFAQENGLSSHVISARTGEMVALCFQKIVAELLGLRLTRAEQEEHQPVMKAEIVHIEPLVGATSNHQSPTSRSAGIKDPEKTKWSKASRP